MPPEENLEDIWPPILASEGEEVPNVLYHYTSPRGLLGMLEGNEIHMSNVRFMNDRSELDYAFGLLAKRIHEKEAQYEEGDREHFALQLLKELPSVFQSEKIQGSADIYGFCFCEDGDSVAQWREYARQGQGYSVGFDTDSLKELHPGASLVKMVYDPERQEEMVDGLLDSSIEVVKNIVENSDEDDDLDTDKMILVSSVIASIFLLTTAIRIKNPVFEDEREWRLVHGHLPDRQGLPPSSFLGEDPGGPLADIWSTPVPDLRFRVQKGQIVPYIGIAPGKKDATIPIVQVIQGPQTAPDIGRRAIRLMTSTFGGSVEVHESDVPLRY